MLLVPDRRFCLGGSGRRASVVVVLIVLVAVVAVVVVVLYSWGVFGLCSLRSRNIKCKVCMCVYR